MNDIILYMNDIMDINGIGFLNYSIVSNFYKNIDIFKIKICYYFKFNCVMFPFRYTFDISKHNIMILMFNSLFVFIKRIY